jgi:uncharacterized membrane protein required for colicin V production
MIDFVVLALLVYFLYKGWVNGFLRTLIKPVALILSCISGLIYYSQTHNLIASLLIGILGPIALNILFSLGITIWHKTVNANSPLSYVSRLSGSCISLLHGSVHFILIAVLIIMTPWDFPWLSRLREQMASSRSYALIRKPLKPFLPAKPMNARDILKMMHDPSRMEKIQSLKEYKMLMEEKEITDLLSDKDILRYIQDKNFSALMAHPKMRSLLKNPKALKKVLNLNVKIIEQSMEEGGKK